MSDKLAKVAPAMLAPQTMDELGRLCSMLEKAQGFIPKQYVGNAPAIGAAIVTGMELGLGPMESLREVYVVDGKPTLSANLMLSLAIKAGIKPQWLQQDAKAARLRLTREGYEPHEQEYTIEDAKRAGLAGKGVWQKHPASMLRARCVSSAMRAFCPDVLGGSVYVHGEIETDEEPRPETPREEPPADVVDVEPEGDLSAEVGLVAQALLKAQTPDEWLEAKRMKDPFWAHLSDRQRESLTQMAAEAKVRISQARQAAEDAALEGLGDAADDSARQEGDAAYGDVSNADQPGMDAAE